MGALMLWFIVMCGDGMIANGQSGIGAAAVECIEVCTSGGGACDGDNAVGIAKAVGNDGVVVAAAAADGGAESKGVGDASSEGGIAAAAGVALAVGVVGVEGAGSVDDASGIVVGGVAAVAIDIAGMCGTDGTGIVNDVCIAVVVVVSSVIFIAKVQSWVSGHEVRAKEASVGRRAQGAGRYEVASAETSREAVVAARAGMLSKVFIIVNGLK